MWWKEITFRDDDPRFAHLALRALERELSAYKHVDVLSIACIADYSIELRQSIHRMFVIAEVS